MAQQQEMTFMEFKNKFNTEDACRDHLFKMRFPDGFICPKCGHQHFYQIKTRHLYECIQCHYQASVIVGTIMERSHIKLEKWFWGIYKVGIDKRGCSAVQLALELHLTYKSAWFMLHRIHEGMKRRDSEYMLSGIVEMDDAYFGTPSVGGKRGRGTDKTKVVVGLSLDNKGLPKYVKMKVVDDLRGTTLAEFVNQNITEGSAISSDAYRSYNALPGSGVTLNNKKFNLKEDSEHLKWLHIVISNAKAFIAGTFHGLDSKHLQRFLDEFSFRFNRRMFRHQMFNRILFSCIITPRITYAELKG